MYNELKWKYRIKHFLALTERGREFLWSFVTFIICTAAVGYFVAHFLVWLTSDPQSTIANIVIHQ